MKSVNLVTGCGDGGGDVDELMSPYPAKEFDRWVAKEEIDWNRQEKTNLIID